MSTEESQNPDAETPVTDPEMRMLLGMFDVPAFARRGQEVEHGLIRLRGLCRFERSERLAMVQMRLRQWSAVSTGPEDFADTFREPVAPLWPLTGCEPASPRWSTRRGSSWRRRSVGRDLIAGIQRFNTRWVQFLDSIDLAPLNSAIEDYNRYYLLEKECCLGSPRLAARHFSPKPLIPINQIADEFPTLPVPSLR